ncbi:MAG: TraK family protein [Anaeromyxobacter sp.]
MSAAPLDRKRRNGLAAFRAVELEVQAALRAGRTVLDIYREKRERLGMSYAQFARYVQPIRKASRAGAPLPFPSTLAPAASRLPPGPRPPPAAGSGPPRGRPEDAVPTLDMDGFAAKALTKKDLF